MNDNIKITDKKLLDLLFYLELPRSIENRMLNYLRQGKISKWFSGIGQEAISVGSTYALNDDDIILPMHRNLGVFTTRDISLDSLFCQLMGKEGGFTKGRDRSFHFGLLSKNIIGMISHLAAMLPVATGFGLASKLKKQKKVVLSFTGDGSTSEGDFHEAINLAAVWDLPIIFLIENNGYGLSTPSSEQFKCKNLSDKAIGYGIKGFTINGNDVLEVYNTISKVAKNIRNGGGPVIIEAITFRMRGHEEASGTDYIPKKIFNKWLKKDPIENYKKYLQSKKILTDKVQEQINKKIDKKIDSSFEFALNSKKPQSTSLNEINDVYKKHIFNLRNPKDKGLEIRYVDSISNSLKDIMFKNDKTIIMGQDISKYGGVFKITKDFLEEFGSERVRNTPIIESGILGASVGLALDGFIPIVEMQFADFVSCGFNQIVNNIAKTHYRWNESLNITIRMPYGGGMSAGPFHSQSPESWFFHTPGLKIVAPSSAYDAKGLLNASVEDPNPVLYFEHKYMYRSIRGIVPNDYYNIEIGKADIKKAGKDASIITYGMGVHWALDIANKLENDNISIEVVDLRSLIPWDKDLVEKSISKTNRVLILHEANLTGGIGAEISAYISEKCFKFLDAPVMRLGAIDTPIPFASDIEKEIYLPINKIEQRIKELLNF
ncbi:MAG: dehydrogenase [Candidatus Marinimicrobia bacterium]|nr:dehydrogenase [Candidatus Neomarinimicrobiota bacterium]